MSPTSGLSILVEAQWKSYFQRKLFLLRCATEFETETETETQTSVVVVVVVVRASSFCLVLFQLRNWNKTTLMTQSFVLALVRQNLFNNLVWTQLEHVPVLTRQLLHASSCPAGFTSIPGRRERESERDAE